MRLMGEDSVEIITCDLRTISVRTSEDALLLCSSQALVVESCARVAEMAEYQDQREDLDCRSPSREKPASK